MAKSTMTYWNVLTETASEKWTSIDGTDGRIEQLILARDERSGDFTRLTKFKAGADTTAFGAQEHDFPEEIYIIAGRLYDAAFDRWLEAGDYASRPPGEIHGPFRCEVDCLVLDISYPSQSRR